MRVLLISNYDNETEFSACIFNNGCIETTFDRSYELESYGLYKDQVLYGGFMPNKINPNNKAIQEFDLIIVCDNGDIDVFRKGRHY